MIINTKFTSTSDIHTEFTSTGDMHTEFCGVIRVENSDVPAYGGEYVVVPKPHENIKLETKGKRLTENVVVLEIPYYEVSNQFGKTISIGGN